MKTKMSSKIVGLKDLRENMEKYIKEIKKGHSFLVVRKSNPVFKIEPTDSWGDDGLWESVNDFNKEFPKGIKLSRLLSALEKDAQNR